MSDDEGTAREAGIRRRRFIGAAAAIPIAAGLPQAATAQATSVKAFEAQSSDGVVLRGDVRGPEGAPEVLFVHGLRQSGLSWEKQLADPALAGFRIARFDLRGHGSSEKPATASSYADLRVWGDDLAAVIDAANLHRPVVVGWSLGGLVLAGYLARHGGGRLAGLNLVTAPTGIGPALVTPRSVHFARETLSTDLERRTSATVAFLRACFARQPDPAAFERMLVVNGMAERAVMAGLVSAAPPDLDAAWNRFDGPILLTYGARDALVSLAMARNLQRIRPAARLSIYPESGHSPFYEDAPRFGRELNAFVRQAA